MALAADVEQSQAFLGTLSLGRVPMGWESQFRSRKGRSPTDGERELRAMLDDEAATLRLLRHELAAAFVATLDAERAF